MKSKPMRTEPDQQSPGRTNQNGPGDSARDGGEWGRLCNELRAERDRLLLQVAELEKERDDYLKALYALTQEDVDFDKKAILRQAARKPSLAEFIAELENGAGG